MLLYPLPWAYYVMSMPNDTPQPHKQPGLVESPVDHHIQGQILRELFRKAKAVPFNELKPDDVQNSLFMYHMRKVETRGLVERTEEGFVITSNGARWVNFVSPDTLKSRLTPRSLIKFLIFNDDESQVLLSRRRGAAAEHVNEYLFPSGFHKYGVSFDDAAALKIVSLTGQSPELIALGIHETIHRKSDGYVHHVIAPLYRATLDSNEFPVDDDYELHWVPVSALLAGLYDATLAEQAQWYLDGNNFAGKTFIFETE